jgi:SdrD B-like domain
VLVRAPTSTTAVLAGTVSQTLHFGTFSFKIPVAGITVHLMTAGGSGDAQPAVTSASNGSYEFDAVAPGAYQVEFVDPKGVLKTQWFNGTAAGSPDQAGAATVTLTAGKATTAVNVSLVS